jgi:CelD/BcsL family acetyltransferase involved in cellulose biosynthesis
MSFGMRKSRCPLSVFYDRPKKTAYAHVTGYDTRFRKLSPGTALFIWAIRDAIKERFKVFDFAQGLDAYKLAFKAEKHDVFNFKIEPKGMKSRIFHLIKILK